MFVNRTKQSIRNIRVSLCFSILILVLRFFSRKVFIDHIGIEVLGLNTALTSLLNLLNLTELGIGSAVSYFLYIPLAQSDCKTVNEIVSLQGWLYKRVTYVILVGSIVLMSFFPWIFSQMKLPLWYAYGSFGVLLIGAILGYIINYAQILLSADQQIYKITYNIKGWEALGVIIQIVGIKYLHYGYFFWLVVELGRTLISCLSLHRTVKRSYPWLHTDLTKGKFLFRKYSEVTRKTKQLFFHKVSSYIVNQTIPLVTYACLSLTMVAVYGNYLAIISNITILFSALFESMRAGIGNLVAEKHPRQVHAFFAEYITARYWLSAVICFCLLQQVTPFISLWLGNEYVLDSVSFYILILSTFFSLANIFESFFSSYGLFQDVFSPVVEGALHLSFSILLGYYWGLPGILAGRVAGLLFLICWKPYFLYSRGFQIPIKRHIQLMGKVIFLILLSAGICQITTKHLMPPYYSFTEWIYNSILLFVYSILVFFILFAVFCKEFRNLFYRFLIITRHKT